MISFLLVDHVHRFLSSHCTSQSFSLVLEAVSAMLKFDPDVPMDQQGIESHEKIARIHAVHVVISEAAQAYKVGMAKA